MRKRSARGRRKLSEVIFHSVNTAVFGIFSLICIFPFYYVFINSISDNALVAINKIIFIPRGIHFENYKTIFQLSGFSSAVFISVARTLVGTFFMLVSVSVLGYAMTRKEYWKRKFWYRYLIVTMYFSAGLIPGYLNMKRLGLLNTFWVYVLPAIVSPYNMILVKTFMENIPPSLEEAAIVDGAGYFQRFSRIIIPLCKPILATVAIFTAVGQWNSFMDTVLYVTGTRLQTLQSILYRYMNQSNMLAQLMQSGTDVSADLIASFNPSSARYAITAVTLLPVFLIYPFFQRYFTKGIMIGAVKG